MAEMAKETLKITWAAARVNAGLTQDEVAKKLKIGKQTLVNWEHGDSEPKISQALAMCDLYQVHIDNIFMPIKSN